MLQTGYIHALTSFLPILDKPLVDKLNKAQIVTSKLKKMLTKLGQDKCRTCFKMHACFNSVINMKCTRCMQNTHHVERLSFTMQDFT